MNEPEHSPGAAENPTPSPPAAVPQVQDQYVPSGESRPVVMAEQALPVGPPAHPRRVRLPVMLFFITCASTFWVGACTWNPLFPGMVSTMKMRETVVANWQTGLIYMFCVLAILFAHEMGHFIATLIYRIPASLPFFIPLPISPIGTMGAVIGMDGKRANRRQMFDIGIAGPLAGMVLAIPIMLWGILQMDMNTAGHGVMAYDSPLLVKWMFMWLRPDKPTPDFIYHTQLNPYYMAGWVGFLITGLNMMPISQLDGGHVIYALFLKRAHVFARVFLFFAIAYIVAMQAYLWILMLVLVIFLGTDHPPTADDDMELGPFRTALGYASLLLPVLCFPAQGLLQKGFWS